MPVSKFLAFDLGAESGRAIVGILEGEKILLEEIHRFPTEQIETKNSNYWDVPFLFREIKKALSIAVFKGHKDIESIGIDTWGVDFGMLGTDGKLLELPHTYRDNRTDGIPEKLFEIISPSEIYAITGIQIMKINSIFQLYSMKLNNESALKKCDKILFMPDLFNYMLTGEKKSEYTIASTSQLLNGTDKLYDEKIFSALEISPSITAPLIPPGTVVGKLSKEISKETGLRMIDVVAVGSHDTASAVAAIPAVGNDWAYISSGTWSLAGIESDKPLIDDRLKYEFTNEGGVNDKITFLKNLTGMWLLRETKKNWERDGENIGYDKITELAANAESSVSFIDTDDSTFINPVNMIEAIDNYCIKTAQKIPSSKEEYVRCILDSLALKYKKVLADIEKISEKKINKIHIVGGGSKNELLNQLTADAAGRPASAGPAEAAALGNILMQAISRGRLESFQHARKIAAVSFPQKLYFPAGK